MRRCILLILAMAAGCAAPPPANDTSKYPHIDTSISYKVDPSWPKKPTNYVWSDMPGIAVDKDDNVWIFTRSAAPTPPVQAYTADGQLVRAWGEDTVGKAHHMKFDHQGNLWLADIGHHVVRKYDTMGKVLLTIGTPDSPGCDETHLNMPTDMVVSPAGDVFISDGYGNHRVVQYDKSGKFVKQWGTLGTKAGEFNLPHAIAMDSKGRLYVADRNNVRVQVFTQDGKFVEEWKDLLVPWGFWVSPKDEIWICGSSPMTWRKEDGALGCPPKDQVFMKFDTAGRLLQLWTVPKSQDGKEKPGELNWVHGMALDSKGNIYAGDIIGKRAQKFVMVKP